MSLKEELLRAFRLKVELLAQLSKLCDLLESELSEIIPDLRCNVEFDMNEALISLYSYGKMFGMRSSAEHDLLTTIVNIIPDAINVLDAPYGLYLDDDEIAKVKKLLEV